MATPLVLSGSSLNTYLRCPKQWEYAYVKRIKSPPTLRLAVGSAGHSAIESDLRAKLETGVDLAIEEVRDMFRDVFEIESYGATATDGETPGQALDSGIKCVSLWHGTIAPVTHPVAVEEEIQFKINDVVVSGTIDVVKKVVDKTIIGDWKFVGKKPASGASYLLNMVGYAIGYRQKTGVVEDGLVLDHMVRTKTPYHYPIASSGPVPDESIEAYAGIVSDVAKGIEAGNFPPNGLQGNACSWCGYKAICPAFRAASI
jgi:hypothetical protein